MMKQMELRPICGGANLHWADLQGANLHGANLDFSCWPLWCSSKNVKVDVEFAKQLALHFTWLVCDNADFLAAKAIMQEFCKDASVIKRHNLKIEKNRDKSNLWDQLEDFLVVYNKMKAKEWVWFKSMDCKYVDLRIDMRDGGCIIKNIDGVRISPEQLAWQYSKEEPECPK